MIENWQLPLHMTALAGLATTIGGFITFFVNKNNMKVLSVGLGFSAGVMIFVSFTEILNSAGELLKNYFPKNKVIMTGNPCSEDALNVKECDKKEFNLSDKPLILFVMGSLGASKVNDFLIKTMSLFNNKDYEILYVTGKSDYDKIKQINFPKNVKVVPYVEKITRVMKKTDIIVTRAGASTLSEIIALKLPSIIIPSPYVPNNHQFKNAQDLVKQNAAIMIEEKNLKGDILVRTIDELLKDKNRIINMKNNLAKLQVNNSATIIYDNIKKLIDRK